MTRIKATLLGIPQQRFEPQKYFNTSVKKPKIEYIPIFIYEFECEETLDQVRKVTKYNYIPHPTLERGEIIKLFGLKIPIFIRKLVWRLEEINNGYVK